MIQGNKNNHNEEIDKLIVLIKNAVIEKEKLQDEGKL